MIVSELSPLVVPPLATALGRILVLLVEELLRRWRVRPVRRPDDTPPRRL